MFIFKLALIFVFTTSAVMADNIGGIPSFSLVDDKLKVPCVKVTNMPGDDIYVDIILNRTDDDYNFKLVYVAVEDEALCRTVEDFSISEDSDYEDSGLDDNSNSDTSNISTDNSNATIEVDCEIRQQRSKISVKGRNLLSGSYYAKVTSGANQATSSMHDTRFNEVEFDFDSNSDDISAGATAIHAQFIENLVMAKIYDQLNNLIVQSESTCEIK